MRITNHFPNVFNVISLYVFEKARHISVNDFMRFPALLHSDQKVVVNFVFQFWEHSFKDVSADFLAITKIKRGTVSVPFYAIK